MRIGSAVLWGALAAAAAGAGGALVGAGAVAAPSRERPRWEYRVLDPFPGVVTVKGVSNPVAAALEARLNELGREGWDLVEIGGGQAIFRRPGP